jgi:type I restriction enzyme R subunit
MALTESVVEDAALAWLEGLGWTVRHGPEIAPGELAAERTDYAQVVLEDRLRQALVRLNPTLPADAIEDAFRKLTRSEGPTLEARNRALHRFLVEGVTVEYPRADGSIAGAQAQVVDFESAENNDWLAVNQFTVSENKRTRRPDVVAFVNGLPLVLVELKNAADENATIWTAFQQLQTYKAELPTLFAFNELLVVSDGVAARVGTLTAGSEWFKPWRTISGERLAEPHLPELQVVLDGIFDKRRLLDLIRDFIVFEDSGDGALAKKMAGYHQFHAVRVAVTETLRAARPDRFAETAEGYESGRRPGGKPGDRRVGVVWHTQGSGKSLTMAFYAGRIIREPAMENPTIVVLTDRNDLDDQLFGTFSRCQDLLRQPPVQAESRADLREKLRVEAGGVVFTTIQKFFPDMPAEASAQAGRHPVLSNRRNIVVIADEAHRSQYDFIDGFARHMRDALPHASFIGFTGTPIELTDKNTRAVFGDYISVYDIQRAVEDKATVPIYYESRLAKLELDETERPKIDPDFEEATEGEEVERKERLKTKWAQLEAVVGSDKRMKLVAKDIVDHFERRLEAMDGKAMVVCMSRRICMELHDQIIKLRPSWYHADDDKGLLKVIMTGNASEGPRYAEHARNKVRREALAKRAPGEARTAEELDHAVRQIVSRAVASEGVIDIFAAAGLQKPDISILSEQFLAEVRGMPQRNLAVELLRKLLSGEIQTRRRKNVVQARSFAEMLERSVRRYQNRAIETAQVIEELIALAKDMREADARGEQLGLSDEEVAFYDALETNDSAVRVLGDETLRTIARELVATVRANVTIDWTVRENVRAHLRVLVKRILRKHGYPPDKQEKATKTVLEQAELLSEFWVGEAA